MDILDLEQLTDILDDPSVAKVIITLSRDGINIKSSVKIITSDELCSVAFDCATEKNLNADNLCLQQQIKTQSFSHDKDKISDGCFDNNQSFQKSDETVRKTEKKRRQLSSQDSCKYHNHSSSSLSDSSKKEETMEHTKKEAMEACRKVLSEHIEQFITSNPSATFEEWIADLHPDNVQDGKLLAGLGKIIDHRFYSEDSYHRKLWNENHVLTVPARPRSDSSLEFVDLLS